MMATSPEHVPEPGTPRNMYQAATMKKKRFSIRGLLSSDKDKKQERQAPPASKDRGFVSSARSVDTQEAETVYQVDVDDRTISVMSNDTKNTGTASEKAAEGFLAGANKQFMLKVVLLLMDPETRRFELLQLEFDSDKALVSDVLTQIPVAVTEEVLKKQSYVGICGSAGTEMSSAVLLSEFCKGNDVLVAVPDGVAASECARLARPILNDEKVINMLKASGIDASAWKEVKPLPPPPVPETISRELSGVDGVVDEAAEEEEAENMKENSGGGGGVFMFVLIVVFAVILQMYHSKITAPIAPGQVLSPGGWVSKCGLASILPTCDNFYLEMDDEGVLSLFSAEGELEWKMEGGVCKSDGCISGLEMRDDGKLAIGGKVVPWVNVKPGADPISPWPFAEEPKLKVIHAKK